MNTESPASKSTHCNLSSPYLAFEDLERFAHVADLEEIKGNDFNLNICR